MLDKALLLELQEYIEDHQNRLEMSFSLEAPIEEKVSKEIYHSELEDFIHNNRKQTLQQMLFNFIDKTGLKDSEIYKKAGIDRKHFSKIRSNPEYRIGKNTAIALAFALELNKKDTEKLLSSAGYSLSDSDTYDLIILFCIEKKIYNIHDVNQALDSYQLKPLS